jgi:hypothetical protein
MIRSNPTTTSVTISTQRRAGKHHVTAHFARS